jgi:hypothetical protein
MGRAAQSLFGVFFLALVGASAANAGPLPRMKTCSILKPYFSNNWFSSAVYKCANPPDTAQVAIRILIARSPGLAK